MESKKALIILSFALSVALAHPRPDEYDIPDVEDNGRSQYYVLHDDGSFKYGYRTDDDAFESQKTNVGGDVDGKFGYTDSDGQRFRIDYTSGTSGFVARGDHIPRVHPDVEAAFAAARAAGPFVDPLAGSDGDRSYNFDFDGEEHSRSEVSDSDGVVTGSYSYIDEFGRTRQYRYRAGAGIGFVIEGDDIPEPVKPLESHVAFANARLSGAGQASSSVSHNRVASSSSRQQQQRNFATYFSPAPQRSNQVHQVRTAIQQPRPVATFRATQGTVAAPQAASVSQQFSHQRVSSRPFEAANTRANISPAGRYSIAYETSSHSRQESGDDDNNVRGSFRFVADDDDEERSLTYEAGAATGFIAEGKHLPVGPVVPGSPDGRVTGRLVPVQQVPFIDPLADDDSDASYGFEFDSDTYSRSETADEDGNVSGTYSILGEDGILRTYRFRAGKGVGFETEEVSAVQTGRRLSAVSQASPAVRSGVSSTAHGSRASAQGAAFGTRASSGSFGAQAATSFGAPARPTLGSQATGSAGAQTSFRSQTTSRVTPTTAQRSQARDELSRRFTLRQYDQSENRGKYGYVLKFDD